MFHSIKSPSNEICPQEALKPFTAQAEQLSKVYTHSLTFLNTGEILFVTQLSIYPGGKFQQILLLKDYYKDQKLSLFWSLLFISSLSMLGIV